MGRYEKYFVEKERREALGFKSIMHSSEVAKIMEKLGFMVITNRGIGLFAAANGYESFEKRFNRKAEVFYKPKGAPIPKLKSLGIRE